MNGPRFDDAARARARARAQQPGHTRRGVAGWLAAAALSLSLMPVASMPPPAAAARCRNAGDCGECQICRDRTCRRAANGASCGTNKRCRGGVCRCDNGFTSCGRNCVDALADRRHCGACGIACAAGETCCRGICANLQSNVRHCGGCGQPCPLNETCAAGACACAPSLVGRAPATCCPGGAGASCIDAETEDTFVQADTCGLVSACPPGYTTCIGSRATPLQGFDSCRACCPPGSACDTALGVCRYA
ncbi:MAG: hypothetical protein ACKOWF_17060 [Chloroflexota bacterium]